MSGLRNLLKQRTYKERSQPESRQHLGLLEKHKDYVLRAKDFHRKEDALKKLHEKAAFRNPDEYYFGMTHTKVQDGVHRKAAAKQPSHDELKVFKKEDASYLQMKRTTEANKIDRLRANLHMLDAPLQNKHTLFVADEASARELDPSCHATTAGEAASVPPARRTSKKRLRAEEAVDHGEEEGGEAPGDPGDTAAQASSRSKKGLNKKARQKLEKAQAKQYSELEQRVERHSKMGKALERLGLEKALMGKGAKRKLKPKTEGAPRRFKWKQRRAK